MLPHTEIVLTGGPASGKTTTLALLQERLTEWGYRVLMVPEVATMVFTGGVPDVEYLAKHKTDTYVGIEGEILNIQMDLRVRYQALADLFNEPCVIIYDRAEMDVRAYIAREAYDEMLTGWGTDHARLRDSYDACIHLTTVALATDAEYAKWTNPGRREDRTMAIAADRRTLDAWLGHPNLHIVDPSDDFNTKQNAVLQAVAKILGREDALMRGRRYLVQDLPKSLRGRRYRYTQHYLRGSTPSRWRVITKRETLIPKEDGTITYYRGEGYGQMVRGRIITRDEYQRQERADTIKDRLPLIRERTCFNFRDSACELDRYENGTTILTVFGSSVPNWAQEEITDDPDYQSATMALS